MTDFLASHNISAQQIQIDHQQRLQQAQQESGTDATVKDEEDKENEDEDGDEEDIVERKKRKRKEEKALMKIKQSKEFKRRKHEAKQRGSDTEDSDTVAQGMIARSKPLPGQLDNCEICGKRFTVTPYSRPGPDGGLLCTKCSKELKDEEKKKAQAQEKKKQRAPVKGRRRQTESDRMMGDVKPGTKTLVESCVRKVADVVHDIDEFGDMPQTLLDRLSQILSKRRALTSRTLDLFLRPEVDQISIYDCGKLETQDFLKIFSFMPDLEKVNLRFAGQMKDEALRYMTNKNKKIRCLQLGAVNLISDEVWTAFFASQGPLLESLKLSELNDSLGDETVAKLVASCPNLQRLKLRSCTRMTPDSIRSIIKLSGLKHLSLSIAPETDAEILVALITALGPELRTLSLEDFREIDDTILAAIKQSCTKLSKLRLTGSASCHDAAFANMFRKWSNAPLSFVDFSSNRDLEEPNAEDEDREHEIGFGAKAFKDLMAHSGEALRCLDLHSNRHISRGALLEVFDPKQNYPALKDVDFSFVSQLDDVVMMSMWKSCPALSKLAVFGCFGGRTVSNIPAGVAVIGLPNAAERMVVGGDLIGEM